MHKFSIKNDDWKKLKKVFQGLLLMFQMLIMENFILILKKYILPTFENLKCDEQIILSMIPNEVG